MEQCGCKEQRKPQKMGCGCDHRCKVVVEPTVYCRTDKDVHHCVKHIIPVEGKKFDVKIMDVVLKTCVKKQDVLKNLMINQ